MSSHCRRRPAWIGALLAINTFLCSTHWASCQGQVREHIFLPRAAGATALSAAIEAQAKYVAAQGDFLESAAIARKINAAAVEHEIANHLRRIDAYFEGRARNRAYRAQENPNFKMREEKRQQAKKEKITKYFQFALKGDETELLNWLLNELSGPILALQYSTTGQWMTDDFSFPLTPEDADHLRLTNRGSGAKEVVFRAGDPEPLRTDWPVGLRVAEFEEPRRRFEDARDQLLAKLSENQDGVQLDLEDAGDALGAIDDLLVTLEEVYPKERRRDHTEFIRYNTGKRYLRTLIAAVLRAIETNDRRLFDGSYQFAGDTVLDLLSHMYRSGLEFASPEPGDEGTYEKLFIAMRTIYMEMTEEDAIPSVDK